MPDDYEVGYRKPPKHTQFGKGQSGNPNGRPKGSRNLKTDLQEELSEKILVREGARQIRVSKLRAVIKRQMEKALKGDNRAAAKLLDLLVRLDDLEQPAPNLQCPLSDEDERVLVAALARLGGSASFDSSEEA